MRARPGREMSEPIPGCCDIRRAAHTAYSCVLGTPPGFSFPCFFLFFVPQHLGNGVFGRVDDDALCAAEPLLLAIRDDDDLIAELEVEGRAAVEREFTLSGSRKHVSCDPGFGGKAVQLDALEWGDPGRCHQIRADQAGPVVARLEPRDLDAMDFALYKCAKHNCSPYLAATADAEH